MIEKVELATRGKESTGASQKHLETHKKFISLIFWSEYADLSLKQFLIMG